MMGAGVTKVIQLVRNLALACLACASWQAMAEDAAVEREAISQKLPLIKELIEETGAAANSDQYANAFSQQMLSILRISNPNLSEKAVQIVEEEVKRTVQEAFNSDSLQSEIYPIYARHFTIEELEGLIAFNRSPVGRKANQVMPLLISESARAAQIWSQKITPQISNQVLKRFNREGIDIRLQPRPKD